MHTSEIKKLVQFTYYVIINYVNLCDDTHHLNATFKIGPRSTSVVLAGDLVPAGTVLVTTALGLPARFTRSPGKFLRKHYVYKQ